MRYGAFVWVTPELEEDAPVLKGVCQNSVIRHVRADMIKPLSFDEEVGLGRLAARVEWERLGPQPSVADEIAPHRVGLIAYKAWLDVDEPVTV